MEGAGDGVEPVKKLVRKTSILVLAFLLLFARFCHADTPPGFSWVNLETDKAIMAEVRNALHDATMTAIREVGVEDGFALVMTASREAGAPTPDYDRWSIYSVLLKTGQSQLLVSGYGVKILDWSIPTSDEIAITYYDCWECEAATVFTTLHFTKGLGWSARWLNKDQSSDYPQPGAVVLMTGVGDPYDDDVVDQVFAVVQEPKNSFAAGYWEHSRNSKTGKIDDYVARYSIDSVTGKERVEELKGLAALKWERQICTPSNIEIQPSVGQNSKACRSALRAAAHGK